MIVHIAALEDLYSLTDNVPEKALALAKEFWPGPLTMIVDKKSCVPDTVTGGLSLRETTDFVKIGSQFGGGRLG